MITLFAELRFAARRLRRDPLFTIFTIALLAIAIGVNTAAYSLLDALSIRDLTVQRPDQLVWITRPTTWWRDQPPTLLMWQELQRRQQVFSSLIGWVDLSLGTVEIDGAFSVADPWIVTGNFYETLGTRPYAGRLLRSDDDPGGDRFVPAAVIGFNYWQRQFGGDRDVIGRTLAVNGVKFDIVGIAPPRFSGVGRNEPDLVLPHGARAALGGAAEKLAPEVDLIGVIGRLKPGVSLAQATAALNVQWPAIKAATLPSGLEGRERDEFLNTALAVTTARKGVDQWQQTSVTRSLGLAMTGSALLLLIACLNLAGLVLSRVAAGSHEWMVRAALGATRWQLTRPVIVEALALTTAGACGAVAIAWAAIEAFRHWKVSGVLPVTLTVSPVPDGRVIAFIAATMVVVTALMSMGASLWLARRDQEGGLQSGSVTRKRFGPALVTSQVILSVVLVTTSALLVRDVVALGSGWQLHYKRDGVTAYTLVPRPQGYDHIDENTYLPQLLEQVQSLPGVRSATLGLAPSPAMQSTSMATTADGGLTVPVQAGMTSPGFFQTLEIPTLRGRDFSWADNSRTHRVVIISRSLARQFFGDEDPLGRRMRWAGDQKSDGTLEIVGIVEDAKLFDFRHPTPLIAYEPVLQIPKVFRNPPHILVRTDAPSAALDAQVRTIVASFGHDYVLNVRTLAERTDDSFAAERMIAELAGCFGAIALMLASIGLYTLLSYAVTQRRKELGIRLALGAHPMRLVLFVAAEGLRLALVGIVVGGAVSWVTSRLLASRLIVISPSDPFATIAMPLVMLVTAAVACLVPAARAARISPIETLRAE